MYAEREIDRDREREKGLPRSACCSSLLIIIETTRVCVRLYRQRQEGRHRSAKPEGRETREESLFPDKDEIKKKKERDC